MDEKKIVKIDNAPIWKIIKKNNQSIKLNPELSEETFDDKSPLKMCRELYHDKENSCNAERIIFPYDENISLVFEKLSFNEPVKLYSSFWAEMGKDSSCNIVSKNRIVLRNEGTGEKFFRLYQFLDLENVTETAGLMFPDGFDNKGNMGITWYSGMYTHGKMHVALYCILRDNENYVKYWHVKEKDGIIVENPEGIPCLEICLTDSLLRIKDCKTEETKLFKL